MVINRVGVLKLGIFQGCVGVLMGLIFAICFMLFGSLISQMTGGGSEAAAAMGMGGIAMLIILPIVYGVTMFIAGIIGAAVYNLVAKLVGGVQIDVT